jgi:hypothetical protein
MSEFSAMFDTLAHQQIEERVARNRQPRPPEARRPRGRHALAQRLHLLADRLAG